MMNGRENSNVVSIRRDGIKKGIYILPNLCTTASLLCGFYSIIHSFNHKFVAAAWAIVIAGVFDFLDGRVARLAHAESDFGVEFDSLSDLASFGLAPAILMYTWGLNGFTRTGWLAAFLFFACGALRLARFNVQSDNVEKSWFQGLPIPLAAGVCATTVIFFNHMKILVQRDNYLILSTVVLLSLLMVSTIPYRSFKQFHFRKRWSFFVLVLALGVISVIAAAPEYALFFIATSYVLWGVIEELITLRKSRAFIEKIRARRENEDEDDEDDVNEEAI